MRVCACLYVCVCRVGECARARTCVIGVNENEETK